MSRLYGKCGRTFVQSIHCKCVGPVMKNAWLLLLRPGVRESLSSSQYQAGLIVRFCSAKSPPSEAL